MNIQSQISGNGRAAVADAMLHPAVPCRVHTEAARARVTTASHAFLRPQVRYSPVNLAGVSLNMAGGVWYTVHKYRSRRQGVRRAMIASASAEPLSILASMEDGSGSKLHMPAAPAKSSRLSQGHVMGNGFNGGANGMYVPVAGDEQEGATNTGQGHLLSPRQRHTAAHDQQ